MANLQTLIPLPPYNYPHSLSPIPLPRAPPLIRLFHPPLPIPQRVVTHLWRVWCCPWAAVFVYHLLVCPIFYKKQTTIPFSPAIKHCQYVLKGVEYQLKILQKELKIIPIESFH